MIGVQDGTKTSPSSSSLSPTTATSELIKQVNITDILSAYKGNLVQVTGVISRIKKDILGKLYVTLGIGAQFEVPEFQEFFDDSMNTQLGQLRNGSRITVICRVDGLMMNVLAKDCVIK